ncbi:putative ribosome-binding factor A, mitochondrial [Linepithema humile]|uniref:putative ribosome-binding factor A, mitochondrial n=1 Tax=Linepithema humile TaxID=83485 RepID=UPI000623866B|nr:PREDICTED: uncharacterized protein LOC105675754 [Linepithema humile]
MQSTRALIMCFQNARYISSSNIYSNISRENRFMKKIMHGTRKSKTKKRWYNESMNLSVVNTSPVKKSLSMHTMRRMAIRDKLFMEHITDQISMGEVSDIINRGIEITHVKITADFKCVNVFWTYSDNNASSLVTEEELQRCAKIIRHELSQLRVIGVVPPIQFVQNKQSFIEKEVEEKLAIIACEKDIDESSLYPDEIQSAVSHVNAINQTLQEEPVSNNDSKIEPHLQLPVMRHDVLGLDHHRIMSRITASLSKSRKAVQRRMLDTENTNADSNLVSQKVTDFLTEKEQQQLFSDFLAKRRIEEKRKRCVKRLREQELNNIEENNEEEEGQEEEMEFDYESEYDIDKCNDNFHDKT